MSLYTDLPLPGFFGIGTVFSKLLNVSEVDNDGILIHYWDFWGEPQCMDNVIYQKQLQQSEWKISDLIFFLVLHRLLHVLFPELFFF